MKAAGVAALLCYAIHAGWHTWQGHPENALWSCHVAALAIGVGVLGGWPAVTGVGVLWLAVGVPLWLADLVTGGEFTPTSILTHVGGLAVGLVAVRADGLPAGTWWKALLVLLVLQQLCRWVTPAEANVNVAFRVYPWMQPWFASYLRYWLAMTALFAALFLLAEYLLRKLVAP